MSDLESHYRRLLRWYPRRWRARNEQVVIGMLLDQAENDGRMTPTVADRASLISGGLHERLLRAERPSALTVVALSAAVSFSFWYLVVITWAPGTVFAGTFGPFTNPAVITVGIFVVGLGCALAGRPRLARAVSALAALCAVALFALAVTRGWLGPGPVPTAVFVGLGIAGTVEATRKRDAVLLPLAVVLCALSVLALRIAAQTYPVVFLPQFWIAAVISVVAAAGATLIVAATIVRAASSLPAPRRHS
jgi:hypothetical protein